MSGSQEQPWSDSPNAPNDPYPEYFQEKTYFAGMFVASIFYGVVIILTSQCIAALFNPAHRKGEPIKWGLVSYTAVTFTLATVFAAINLDIQVASYIDNRAFPGVEDLQIPPGPFGYNLALVTPEVPLSAVYTLNNWLADGLLLYRCYFIYSKNVWAIAFPCLMYLGSVAMGILYIYQNGQPGFAWSAVPYFSISLSLNIILTLMIVIRLTLHARGVRTAMGGVGSGGLCKAIVTMFIESCAIYSMSSVLVLALMGVGSSAMNIFILIIAQTQVIAPLFVIHRVANKSALTSNTLVSGRMSTFKARSGGELTDGGSAVPGGDSAGSVDEHKANTRELGDRVETAIDSHNGEVF